MMTMMMMMQQKPTVDVPPWPPIFDDPMVYDDPDDLDLDAAIDAYSCDEFRMYEFKIRRCARARSHDWTECPYAHPGEKARRRDPRRYHYSGTACAEFRKGGCKRGDACEMAHGVFECWLHPARYRTQPCKDGTSCRRRVCFFAHTPDQLRVLPQSPKTPLESYDGSPMRKVMVFSQPVTPTAAEDELAAAMRKLKLGRGKAMRELGFGVRYSSSLPATPTQTRGLGFGGEEEGFERVDSGRELRAKMYERLSMESGPGYGPDQGPDVDVGWVSDLVK